MEHEELSIREAYAAWKSSVSAPELHPDDQVFICFVEGLLSRGEAAKVREHLLCCSGCACRLRAHVMLQPPAQDPPAELIEKIRRLLDRLIGLHVMELGVRAENGFLRIVNTSGDVLVGQEFVPAGLFRARQPQDFRDGLTVLKDFRDLRVELRIDAKKEFYFLNVFCKDKETQVPLDGLRVSLFSGETELESYSAAGGKAAFEHVEAGKYRITVSSDCVVRATLFLDITGA